MAGNPSYETGPNECTDFRKRDSQAFQAAARFVNKLFIDLEGQQGMSELQLKFSEALEIRQRGKVSKMEEEFLCEFIGNLAQASKIGASQHVPILLSFLRGIGKEKNAYFRELVEQDKDLLYGNELLRVLAMIV